MFVGFCFASAIAVQTPRRRGNPRPLSPPTGNCADVLASDHCRMFELRCQSPSARYSGPCLHGYGCGTGFCSPRVGTSTIAQSPTAAPHSWPLGCCNWVFVMFSLPHILIDSLWLCQLSFASTVPSCTHPIGQNPCSVSILVSCTVGALPAPCDSLCVHHSSR